VTVFHDLQHKKHPEYFRWFDLPFWRLLLWLSAHRSKKLLAVSEATRSDSSATTTCLLRRSPWCPRCGGTVLRDRTQRAVSTLMPYILAVSTLHPHKNLDRLVRAFAEFRQTQPGFRLVIAACELLCGGTRAADCPPSPGRGGGLDGWVSRERLAELYAGAWAYINPTLLRVSACPSSSAGGWHPDSVFLDRAGQGCGWAGCAALCSDGRVGDPGCLGSNYIGRGVARPAHLRGTRRAAEFSWRRSAELTLAALSEAADSEMMLYSGNYD